MPDESAHQPPEPHAASSRHRRRPRYRGTHPRRFEERYKEHAADRYPGISEQVRARGATPAGTHVPILLTEVLDALQPAPEEVVCDCTLGYGGHAEAFLRRIGPAGLLVGFDLDAEQLERSGDRLRKLFSEHRIVLHQGNYAGLGRGVPALPEPQADGHQPAPSAGYDVIFADLGVSSMQVDDPGRGFSYKYPGPLDMRMDRKRRRTAADLLASLSEDELARALVELGDERDGPRIAQALVRYRSHQAITQTAQLVRIVLEARGLSPVRWREELMRREQARSVKPRDRLLHPAAKTFQALRILVNDELGSLAQLLRVAPYCLRPGGRIGLITFHSGEDRLVQQAFGEGGNDRIYSEVSAHPVRPSPQERRDNPRSRSAQFRWARRAGRG